jgi:hypothetical protein
MFQLISESIGLMCAIVTPSSTYAILVRGRGVGCTSGCWLVMT